MQLSDDIWCYLYHGVPTRWSGFSRNPYHPSPHIGQMTKEMPYMFTLRYNVRKLRKVISSVDMEVRFQKSITLKGAVIYRIYFYFRRNVKPLGFIYSIIMCMPTNKNNNSKKTVHPPWTSFLMERDSWTANMLLSRTDLTSFVTFLLRVGIVVPCLNNYHTRSFFYFAN